MLSNLRAMPQFDPNTEMVHDGGFRIDIQLDELAITADKSAWKIREKTATSRVLSGLFLLAIFFMVIFYLLPNLLRDGPFALAAIALIFFSSMLIAYIRGHKDLHCNRKILQVVRVARGRIAHTADYPIESIQKIRFATVSYHRYGSICGLVFEAQGKKVKVLRGLESPEAQRILAELHRLGFDTVPDIGMPMMAEMVIERRKSWLGH